MAIMTIRNIDESVKKRLRIRAATNGRSMEEEAREILRTAVSAGQLQPSDLGRAIHSRFTAIGGVDLPTLAREPIRDPIDLGG